MTQFVDFGAITEHQRYKLMASLIVPRPIALVTTLSEGGVVNAAPFSMFNMLGEEPPIVMISVNRLHDGAQKDTATNIARTQRVRGAPRRRGDRAADARLRRARAACT